ncbi:hypothetical protein ACJJTC_009736 [Scirpophaga incertulas]
MDLAGMRSPLPLRAHLPELAAARQYDQVVKRTCAATGISKSTLMKIKQEARELRQASPPRASPSTSQGSSNDTRENPNAEIKLSTPDKLGYKFKKCKNARTVLIQKPDIAAWRARYLRRMKYNNDLGTDKKPSEKEIEKLTRDAINSITPSDWKKEVNHVERLQQEYWEKDHLEEENVREFIISLGEESSDSEISDSDDELMTGIEPIIYSEDDS